MYNPRNDKENVTIPIMIAGINIDSSKKDKLRPTARASMLVAMDSIIKTLRLEELAIFLETEVIDSYHKYDAHLFFGKERVRALMNEVISLHNYVGNQNLALMGQEYQKEVLMAQFEQLAKANYEWQTGYNELVAINEENRLAFIKMEGSFNILRRNIIELLSQTNKMTMLELHEAWPDVREYFIMILQINENEKDIWGLK